MTDVLPAPSAPQATKGGVRTRVVLDTSVLVADPTCLHHLRDVDIVVPLTVIEELDSLKTRPDDVGRSARAALRAIEEIRVRAGGSLATAVALGSDPGSSTLQIEVNGIQHHLLVEHGLDPKVPDNRIIGAALGQSLHAPTVMVSNDAALRIKAAHLGVSASEHQPVGRAAVDRHAGWTTIEVGPRLVDELYASGATDAGPVIGSDALDENSFAVLRAGSQSALTRRVGPDLVLLGSAAAEAWVLLPTDRKLESMRQQTDEHPTDNRAGR